MGRASDQLQRKQVSIASVHCLGTYNKQVVSVNKYLMTEDFNDDKDTLAPFRWARNSTEAKEAVKMEEEFLQKVKATKALSQKSKEMAKHKRQSRALDLLTKCSLEHYATPRISDL